ncbi:MAG: hypothetical protein QXH21_09010 [Ignisphaera sp.]
MGRSKSISNLVTVLGLIAVAVVAVAVGYTVITQYVSQMLKPSPELSVPYAKLVFITDSEVMGLTTYVTFKGEVGISNPGTPVTGYVCVVSMVTVTSSNTQTLNTTELSNYCSTIFTIGSGYNTYSFILRIPRTVLDSLGCQGTYSACPVNRMWHFSVYAKNPRTETMERVSIVRPIYMVPS